MLVEKTVRAENIHFPNRPIYLVGESVGGCLALAVAARNPDIDLVLVLANPATSLFQSQLQPLLPILKVIPDQLCLGLPYVLGLMTGLPSRMMMSTARRGLSVQQTVTELVEDFVTLFSYLHGLADVVTVEILNWKLNMLESANENANSCLNSISAETLILSSGNDQLFPSLQEGQRLRQILTKCQIRTFNDCGHALFLEEGFDLVSVIKVSGFYRRRKHKDYVSDFLRSPVEMKAFIDSTRWLGVYTSPVMISTLGNGNIVRGLAGIPSEGPVLYVGNHNVLGFDIFPMVRAFLIERNILLQGIAHPFFYERSREGIAPGVEYFDLLRMIGGVPVSPSSLYKLFAMKSHVFLYPGGMREALHRKGEEYKLFWPKQSEFVRMAARFGTTIIPFGGVGEDEFADLVLDYDDQLKVPPIKALIDEAADESVNLRADLEGEVANQQLHSPLVLPKVPGRFYFFFGKPIITKGREEELRNKDKAEEVYLEVKSEVEKCIAYCREKKEYDPYRNIIPRLMYMAKHGLESEIPTFELQ